MSAFPNMLIAQCYCSGTCPFGTSCFYAHKYPDGTLASREVRTAVDSEGQYDVLRQIRLEQYFERQTLDE